MDKCTELTDLKRSIMVNKYILKACWASLTIRELQIKTIFWGQNDDWVRRGIFYEENGSKYCQGQEGGREKRNLYSLLVIMKTSAAPMGSIWNLLNKNKNRTITWPSSPTPRYTRRNRNTEILAHPHLLQSNFTIAKI